MSDEDERSLLARIGAEDGPATEARLIYADWCEERGRAEQAELLRLACELEGQLLPDARAERRLRRLQQSPPVLSWAPTKPDWLLGDDSLQGVPRAVEVFGPICDLPEGWVGQLCGYLAAIPSIRKLTLACRAEEEGRTWWEPQLTELLSMPQLRSLHVQFSEPDLRLGDAIVETGHLRELALMDADRPGWARLAGRMSSLRRLALSMDAPASSRELRVLLETLELESLSISLERLGRQGERLLAGQQQLRRADLADCRTGWFRKPLVALAKLPRLESLDLTLHQYPAGGRRLAPLLSCPSLRSLGIHAGAGLIGPLPTALERLALSGPVDELPSLPSNLRWLEVHWPLRSLAGIERAQQLEHLKIWSPEIAPAELRRLQHLPSLRSLELSDPLSADTIFHLACLTQLETLIFNRASPELDLSGLRALTRLQRLEPLGPWVVRPASLRQLTGLPCSDELMETADLYDKISAT